MSQNENFEDLSAFAVEDGNENTDDLSAFAVEGEQGTTGTAVQEDFSKYEVETKQPALNNGDLSKFACGFPDFVLTVNESVSKILVGKIAERKAAVNR